MGIQIIKTKEELKAYMLSKMGFPQLNNELDENQLSIAIDDAVKEFSEVAMAAQDETILCMELDGSLEYALDGRIKSILKIAGANSSSGVSSISWGGVFRTADELYATSVMPLAGVTGTTTMSVSSFVGSLAQLSTLKSLFSTELKYRWNEYTKRLTMLDRSKGKVLIHCTMSYIPQEVDYIYDNVWVKAYALALAKKNLATIWGKYDTTLINGSKLNYEAMKTDADAEINALKEELADKWTEPLGIIRG